MFIKKFKFTRDKGLQLINRTEVAEYIDEKIKYFSDYNHFSNKESLLNFFDEISDMIEHDKKTAQIDFSEIEGVVEFPKDIEMMINYYDIVYLMGKIFLEIIDVPANHLKCVKEGVKGPINTANMFSRAYTELCCYKVLNKVQNENLPAYGATLIFATLFESELKTHVMIHYSKEFLSKLNDKILSGEIKLKVEDEDLLKHFNFEYGLSKEPPKKTYDIFAVSERKYAFLKKYKIMEENDSKMEQILNCSPILTLNIFLKSEHFTKIVDNRFLKIVDIIFDNKKLNLRNNLAHCNCSRTNYYNITVTSLLFMLVYMVSEEYYLK